MSYLNYVIGAYAVFCIVMLWDFVAPRIDIARQLRAARLRATRKAPRPGVDTLSRTETE